MNFSLKSRKGRQGRGPLDPTASERGTCWLRMGYAFRTLLTAYERLATWRLPVTGIGW